jgi:2-C-methyl-D-erythritol 4-phosphate cytidylyltransferase
VWAVVVAGGRGARYGRPKQFDLLAGRPVVEWAVAGARTVADGVVLVLPPDRAGMAAEGPAGRYGADAVVDGGVSRSASVRHGLAAVPGDAGVVVVHDAARPFASEELFRSVLEALLDGAAVGGAICAVPVTDTLKRVVPDGTRVTGTVDRTCLVAVQTPQAFRADVLRRAHASAGDATDDAALVEALGAEVRVVPGEARNVKVTTPADLAYLEHLLASER